MKVFDPKAIPAEALAQVFTKSAIEDLKNAQTLEDVTEFSKRLMQDAVAGDAMAAIVLATKKQLMDSEEEAEAIKKLYLCLNLAMFMGYQLAQAQLAVAPAVS
jgi:hypothetical protein